MTRNGTIAAALLAAGLGLAGAGHAQEQQRAPVPIQKLPQGNLERMRAPKLAPDAQALHAKLVKAQADLTALASQPPPPGASPRDVAALQAKQAEDQRLAQKLQALADELAGGAAASDVGQKLQFQLQEANNIYQRAQQAQSSMVKKQTQTSESIIQNLK